MYQSLVCWPVSFRTWNEKEHVKVLKILIGMFWLIENFNWYVLANSEVCLLKYAIH